MVGGNAENAKTTQRAQREPERSFYAKIAKVSKLLS
jgi:hypothetical protein